MYRNYRIYQCPCYPAMPIYDPTAMYTPCPFYQCPQCINHANSSGSNMVEYPTETPLTSSCQPLDLNRAQNLNLSKDYGPDPFVIDIEDATEQNNNFRTTLWTGEHLQLTLMSIDVGEDIGLEVHHDHDQFVRIEEGNGLVRMGDRQNNLTFERSIDDDDIVMIPAGTWHNLINTGTKPLKLYSLYAPPEHPKGTIHKTKAESEAAEY